MVTSRRVWLSGLVSAAGSTALGCTSPAPPPRGDASSRASAAADPLAILEPRRLRDVRMRLIPLHERTKAPQPGDWLHDHPEDGQGLDDYLRANPTRPTEDRKNLVVLPLGTMSADAARIVALTSEYLTHHFGLPSRVDPAIEVDPPKWARRTKFGSEQLLTRYILEKVLPPKLPKDAASLMGFTTSDLWPGDNWNFVFGEASLTTRVGVWSLHRYGDPSLSEEAFRLTLRRALKVGVHEAGHMFSLEHCIRYPCVQAGTNSIEETDRSPLWLCPDCLPKIAWVTQTDPRQRLSATRDFCKAHGLSEEAAFTDKNLQALEA